MATNKSTTDNYKYGNVVAPNLPQPTWLTPKQLEEKKQKSFVTVVISNTLKVMCAQNKLFNINCKEEEQKEQ